MWKVHWSIWPGHGTKKKLKFLTVMKPTISQTPGGCSIHWATRTNGYHGHFAWPWDPTEPAQKSMARKTRQAETTNFPPDFMLSSLLSCIHRIHHLAAKLLQVVFVLLKTVQGFHRVWKHFRSWKFGKWPIIVLAFSVGKKEKSANFWMNFSLKISHLWVIIILGDQKLPPQDIPT